MRKLIENNSHKKIAIVCNPVAGGGKALKIAGQAAVFLAKENIFHQVFTSHWPEDLNGFSEIWISGGDGTLHYFINKYKDVAIPLAILPGGSGNDFYWLLYKEQKLQQQLEQLLTMPAQPVDAGLCSNVLFINGVGIGFDGAIVKDLSGKKKYNGKLSYTLSILMNIFFYKEKKLSITTGNTTFSVTSFMINIANGKRYGGGFLVAPSALPNDSLLDVNLIKKIKWYKRIKYLPVIEKGKHQQLPFVKSFQTSSIIIEASEDLHAHADGEYMCSNKFEIKCLKNKFLFKYQI